MSVQQRSSRTSPAGHPGLGTMAALDEVTTTRRTPPASLAARSTFSVPSTAGTISCFCDQRRSRSVWWWRRGQRRRTGQLYLGIADGVDGAGGGEVEDARAAPRGIEEHRAVEEVAAEDAEATLAGAGGEREEVVSLRLVICTATARFDNHRNPSKRP